MLRGMAKHVATIRWRNPGGDFVAGRYSREHTWTFDGGVVVPASPSPSVVRPPYSNPAHVDPEEAFVAAISSCHMLTFLYCCAKAGLVVMEYEDEAVGTMTKNEHGVSWVSTVVLSPRIAWGERVPSPEELARLHDAAHHECFIANSVKTEIVIAVPR
jgi:organic hydroperoxide reductase OsmC/OhrA